ncbi:hypothetical protein BJ170DRAFT_58362 [Xylariales sp. AK1849]|nr:hypothetical protein BJ170DRAFT_58362 [Xylariales sp. AK1849]
MACNPAWEHQYCLSCDRQTDGATYCSESCRLSDFDKSSTTFSTPASSPGLAGSNFSWTTPKPQAKFYLSPAYDFSKAQPYGSTPQPQSFLSRRSETTNFSPVRQVLTPSSSHSSLNSLQSNSSTGSESRQLSDKARKQLRDYASSFENARLQRRRSC